MATCVYECRLFFGFLFCILLVPSPVMAGKSVPIIPIHGTAVKVNTGGKEKTYYLASPRNPLEIEVDGPGKLVCLTRLVFPSVSGGTERYVISVSEGDKGLKRLTTQTEKSNATTRTQGEVLGRIRKTSLVIPEGTHKYRVAVEGTLGNGVLVKLLFTPKKGKSNLVSMEPLSYDKVVTALVKEKLITYYVSSKKQQVHLRIIGPTKLKVAARLNYDASMKGGQRYSLAVTENNKRVVLKALATTKSAGTEYREWKDVVPGKPNSFYVTVPSGEHQYSFSLEEGLAKSVSLKFSIPKSDLQNEE